MDKIQGIDGGEATEAAELRVTVEPLRGRLQFQVRLPRENAPDLCRLIALPAFAGGLGLAVLVCYLAGAPMWLHIVIVTVLVCGVAAIAYLMSAPR